MPAQQLPSGRTTTSAASWQVAKIGAAKAALPETLSMHRGNGQTWEGFGGCFNELGEIALRGLARRQQDEIIRALFGKEGCNFNYGRMSIGANDYAASWYSHNETGGDFAMRHFSIARDRQYVIPFIRRAQALRNDLTMFASPWSPPTWLKSPPVYNYGTLIWEKRHLDAYALYFAKFCEAYAALGIPIRQIHIQNEPVANQKFPSCVWTGGQMRDFIRDHIGPLFRRRRIDCELWLGTLNTADYDAFPFTVLSDPKANAYVAGVGFQWDGKGAVQRTRDAWPEKRLMQTENECGDGLNTWEYAGYVFNLLQHYLAGGVNAYLYWNMILEPGGRSTWGWNQNAMITVDRKRKSYTLNPEFHVMKHFSHFIRPGAQRLDLAGMWASNAVAFLNPDGRTACVLRNPLKTPQQIVLRAPAGGLFKMQAPADSINTVML
jgi:glucosylceramidase